MKTDTREKIINLAQQKSRIRPHEIAQELKISLVAVHKQLKKLVLEGSLLRIGRPPLVFYTPYTQFIPAIPAVLGEDIGNFINKEYMYITPSGLIVPGVKGFTLWVQQTKQMAFFKALANEYVHTRQKAKTFFSSLGCIEATKKIQETFSQNFFLDKVFYLDFYALPKFGKTRLGQLVLHAKLAQHEELIARLATEFQPVLKEVIKKEKVEAIGFIPHSIPRKVPFLKELRRNLEVPLPEIELVKAYSGEIPVAQKSLSKLEERQENAQDTIFIKNTQVPYKTVVLIDDAVGSGATFNETARKLKRDHSVERVIGLAIVGSMKGFDVIREV